MHYSLKLIVLDYIDRDASMVSIVRILLLTVCAATLVRGQTSGKYRLHHEVEVSM